MPVESGGVFSFRKGKVEVFDISVTEWLGAMKLAVSMCAELNGRSTSPLTGKSIIKKCNMQEEWGIGGGGGEYF